MKLSTRLFIADLTHLDCAWFDPAVGLMGETWRVDAEIGGKPADDGMLVDFGIVKNRLKAALDEKYDHRLLLARNDVSDWQDAQGHYEVVLENSENERTRYRAPHSSFARLESPTLNTKALAQELSAKLRGELPDNAQDLTLTLTPAHDKGPYRYCHGLSKHAGNCQRMAHGHRAVLEILHNGQRHAALEQQWQQQLQGRYIGAEAHLQQHSAQQALFAYRGSQGDFELELPAHRAYVLEADPTIESITAHMAKKITMEHGGHAKVTAFEGIGKGAISECSA